MNLVRQEINEALNYDKDNLFMDLVKDRLVHEEMGYQRKLKELCNSIIIGLTSIEISKELNKY